MIAEVWFPYDHNDCWTFFPATAAIVAIIWQPAFRTQNVGATDSVDTSFKSQTLSLATDNATQTNKRVRINGTSEKDKLHYFKFEL